MRAADGRIEIWVDVGGTFTDCILPDVDGSLRVHKLLSSGRYAGRVGPKSTCDAILDERRRADPPAFFVGWNLHLCTSAPAGSADRQGANHGSSPPLARRIVAFDAERGRLRIDPPLASAPSPGTRYEIECGLEAPLCGARWLLRRGLHESLADVELRLGTTRGTNALLERRGARVLLVTTRGFGDALRIGYQDRPRLFDLHVRKAAPLFERVLEVDERIASDGTVLAALDESAVAAELDALRRAGFSAAAIVLLNSYRNALHEERLAQLARGAGFSFVARSAEIAPLQGLIARGQAAVIDAYLQPALRDYLMRLENGLDRERGGRLLVMASTGGLQPARAFVAKDSVLSGPAGGAVGVARVAVTHQLTPAIGLDMGGTSTDVCRFGGELERREHVDLEDRATGGLLRMFTPALAIETVAAGGGSVCEFDGFQLTVGPHSAGVDPGPACYGRGGPLTLTDANLLLGRIDAAHFPFTLDETAARCAADACLAQLGAARPELSTREQLAEALVAIADAHVAAAIRRVSLLRGFDPAEHSLVSFGGAGGQHACGVARQLGMRRVCVPAMASVLSAYGIGGSRLSRVVTASAGLDPRRQRQEIEALLRELEVRAGAELIAEFQVAPESLDVPGRWLEMRFRGQESTLAVEARPESDWVGAFHDAHAAVFGFAHPERALEVRSVRVEARTRERPVTPIAPTQASVIAPPERTREAWLDGARRAVAEHRTRELPAGARIQGPALLIEPETSVWLERGWTAQRAADGSLHLLAEAAAPARGAAELELQTLQISAAAEQMGAVLRRTATSTNVKERLDFSCAVCDANGELIAHAPHVPVHLGAMSASVQGVLAELGARGEPLRPGESYITNDPFLGGSHLPDLTVVTPVFDAMGQCAFLVANRAHHAEIGGIVPGSMPAASRTLAEEGVRIRLLRLSARSAVGAVDTVDFDESALRAVLAGGAYPSRAVEENLADVRAQLAANHRGAQRLRELLAQYGAPALQDATQRLHAQAQLQLLAALHALPAGEFEFEDALDDGAPIRVCARRSADGIEFDFAGSAAVLPGNLNATPAIVASAVIYCLRCLVKRDIPLNAGLLRVARLRIPPGSLLSPESHPDSEKCPAVVGGNVETSQRVVDCILGALGAAAASQGTMNNLAFGNDSFGYYETIGGGAGAGPGFPGADAVHVHMTNTRLTDPEVLEARYPVRVRTFAIRRGSGGAGRWRGGDGIVRELEFLAPLQVSLLTQRRTRPPFGLGGGAPGQCGRNTLLRAGEETALGWAAQITVAAHDVLRIETPGGGGYGMPRE